MKSQSSIYWFTLFAVCFIGYQQIIDNIRPHYHNNNVIIKYFLGIAPNFLPAIGIPALFVAIISHLKRYSVWFNSKSHITANLISLSGLIAWEFIQTTSKKLFFDWNDVLWTILGALVFQLIWVLTPTKYKEKKTRMNNA
jgi:hypothetical protein